MARILKRTKADSYHEVVTVQGGGMIYRKTPCEECPWRKDVPLNFPAQAFRISASTAYDMSDTTFACHMSGKDKAAICAGFLLRGADHNLKVRLLKAKGKINPDKINSEFPLFDSYREMSEANGVDPHDPVLSECR